MTELKAPSAEDVKEIRSKLGLTQAAAAECIHVSTRTWIKYESDERQMHVAFWELFQIKNKLISID